MSIDNLSTLADALLPHLVDRLGGGGGTAGGSSVTLPSVIRWSDIDKSGASLYDIPDRPHGALTYKNVDDHLQYVPQAGRGGIAYLDAIVRVRNATANQYTMDLGPAAGGGILNSYDSTTSTYLPLRLDGSTINLRLQAIESLTIGNNSIWYSGISTINTDNYVSQLAGLHLGYDGSIDCRYLYTEQLHAKAFIADLEQALAGAQIIAKSVTILDQTFTAPYPGIGLPITVKDLPSAHGMQVFQAGDYVRVRQFSRAGGGLSITDCWGQVYSPADNGNGTQTWNFIRSGAATYSTIAFVNATALASGGSGPFMSAVKPTGTASGHVLLAEVVYTGSPTVTEPAGWTLITTHTATGLTAKYYYKLAGGSEPSAYTWNFSVSTNAAIVVAAYSGCNAAHYIDGYNVSHTDSGTAMTAPGGIYPYSAAGMLVFLGATANVRATPPSGMTERADLGTVSAGVYLADQLLAGALTSSKTATLAASSASIGLQILLTPSYTALNTEAGAMAPFNLVEPDAIVLDYGVSGNGYAEVTTVDGIYGANSPYYQIVTWTGHPATGPSLKARLGNLSGIADTSFSSLAGKYGLYSDSVYLKGDLETGNGNVRIYQDSGINLQEDPSINWSDLRAIQWWPDIDVRTGTPSLALVAGLTLGENYGLLRASPTNNQLASLTLFSTHQGSSNDAYMTVTGGSQARGSIATIILGADRVAFFAEMGDGWKSLSYTNSGGTTWTDYGGGWQVGQYKKVGDLVFVRGLGKRTAGSGATIATLPSGYRPASYSQLFVTLTDGGVGRIDVGTGGDMSLVAGTAGWVALNLVFSVV